MYGNTGRDADDGEEDEGRKVEEEESYEDRGRAQDRHDGITSGTAPCDRLESVRQKLLGMTSRRGV